MDHQVGLLLLTGIFMLTIKNCRTISVPFTHDFNYSLHGWTTAQQFWSWTPNSSISAYNTSILNDRHYVWTQRAPQNNFSQNWNSFYSPLITGVTRDTKFHFKLFFYSTNPTGLYGIYIYMMYQDSAKTNFDPSITIKQNSSQWEDRTIDCQHEDCCYTDSCDLTITIIASAGGADGTGIAAIGCVTTVDNGCKPQELHLPSTTPPNDYTIISSSTELGIVHAGLSTITTYERSMPILNDTKTQPSTITNGRSGTETTNVNNASTKSKSGSSTSFTLSVMGVTVNVSVTLITWFLIQ